MSQLTDVPRLLDEVGGALRILEAAAAGRVPGRRAPLHPERTARAQARAERPAARHARRRARLRSSTTSKRCATTARTARASSTSRARAWKRCITGRCRPGCEGAGPKRSTSARPSRAMRRSPPSRPNRSPPAGRSRSSPSRPCRSPKRRSPHPVATGAAGGFEATSDDIDDEIREVFLEEFEEEIGHLESMLPAWRARTGRQRQAASDPSRLPHAQGLRPPRGRQDARRVQLEDREHAQPRARRHASAEPTRSSRSSTRPSTRCRSCTPRCAAKRR